MTKSYRTQFQACNADGTCQHMSRERYLSMPEAERRAYDDDRVYFKIPADYYGPRGPLFCCIKPGRCASKHCPLIKDNLKTIYEANDGSD